MGPQKSRELYRDTPGGSNSVRLRKRGDEGAQMAVLYTSPFP